MSKRIFGATIVLAMTFAGYSPLSVAADKDAISMVQTTVTTTVSPELIEAVRKGLTGFDKNDRGDMIAALDDNVVFEFSDSLPYGGTYSGKKEFLAFWKHVYKEYEYFNYDARAVLASGDYLLVPVVARAKTKTGYSMENEHLFLFRVKNGKIIYGRIYADTARGRDVLEGHQPRKYPKLILE